MRAKRRRVSGQSVAMQSSRPDSSPSRAAAVPVAVWAVIAGLAALLAWDASGLDLWVMRHVGSAAGFALRESWFTTQVIHQGGRLLSWGVVGFIVLVNLWPARLLPPLTRRERLTWLLVTLLCLVVVSGVKRVSLTSCPWDLAEFGGTAQYVSHWAFGLSDGGGGHCFPSGHASAAFAFLCGGWVLARAYPRAARAWLVGVVALGVVYGVGQMLRGAHYPSHTMWTGWICWAVTVAATSIGPGRLRRSATA
jgi:membrane-associated PAP2 superfamily phosphatase